MTLRGVVDVAVVGGGIAGSAVAARLAARGYHVVVLERRPTWRWHACGVFSSPAAVVALRRLGLDEACLAAVARPVPAMRVEPSAAPAFRLTYGAGGSAERSAVGFDRATLDPALLRFAEERGAEVRRGATVVAVDPSSGRVRVRDADDEREVAARVVVGADGIRSIVARATGVARPARLAPRTGLTYHVADPRPEPHDARMVILSDGYVGIAPVPGDRLNVGIVLGPSWRRRLAAEGAAGVARTIVDAAPCDTLAGAAPIGHRVTRCAGAGWLLVGDAAGFLDPFTGEGIHRALVSAELAAVAIDAHLAGRGGGLPGYERAMRARFRGKDVVSSIVQAFLGRPALFDYAARRLASRDEVRETMGLVIGDLVPASRALDPRHLAALLAP